MATTYPFEEKNKKDIAEETEENEMKSGAMIFTEDELQILANAIVVYMRECESNGFGLDSFISNMKLLNRMNAELDDIDYQRMKEEQVNANAV